MRKYFEERGKVTSGMLNAHLKKKKTSLPLRFVVQIHEAIIYRQQISLSALSRRQAKDFPSGKDFIPAS